MENHRLSNLYISILLQGRRLTWVEFNQIVQRIEVTSLTGCLPLRSHGGNDGVLSMIIRRGFTGREVEQRVPTSFQSLDG
ncbi:hypothetical protein GBA52_026511 [Prunus armeniaca]|nr:hypothetical protein GBA52_026511 [Prunus armeniaca]